MSEALNWPLEAFREAFGEVLNEGMAKADWKARVLWVPKAIKHNFPASANVVTSWRSYWEMIPECELKSEAHDVLIKALAEAKGFSEAFGKACRKPSAKLLLGATEVPSVNQNQIQKQIQLQHQNENTAPSAGVCDNGIVASKSKHDATGFVEWYEAYPLKKDKGHALKAFIKLAPSPELVQTMIQAIANQIVERKQLQNSGAFVPNWKHPATWLNGRCWEDDVNALNRSSTNGQKKPVTRNMLFDPANDPSEAFRQCAGQSPIQGEQPGGS